MKIAYLGIKGLPSQWGADRVVEAIVERLASGHELTVYCDRRAMPHEVVVPGVRLVRIPTLPGKHMQAVSLYSLAALHALFRGGYDLVHVHNAEAGFVVPFLQLRFRTMATSHGKAYLRDKWGPVAKTLIRLTEVAYARSADVLTCVSQPLAEEYMRRYTRHVHYLPNGVESNPVVDDVAASATLEANGVQGDYMLFAAGRLDPTKGCHLLLNALDTVGADMRLVVVGNTATLPAYGEQLRRTANDRVTFIPFVRSKAELFGIVRQARLFVFPSTVEAMSMMLLEAASLGVPTIASDIPENTTVLDVHAIYFRSGDVEDLASKLRWAMEYPDRMADLGVAAREYVKRTYSWDTIAEQYDVLYRQMSRRNGQTGKRTG